MCRRANWNQVIANFVLSQIVTKKDPHSLDTNPQTSIGRFSWQLEYGCGLLQIDPIFAKSLKVFKGFFISVGYSLLRVTHALINADPNFTRQKIWLSANMVQSFTLKSLISVNIDGILEMVL